MTVEESDVEVKETPAPKSRRGRKERADQSEAVAVSVSETPRKVHVVGSTLVHFSSYINIVVAPANV